MDRLYRALINRLGRFMKTDADVLFRGTFWLSLGSLAGMGVAFALSVLYARYITKDVYGEYRYVLSVLSTLGIFTFPGLGIATTRAIARGFERTYYHTAKLIFRLSSLVAVFGVIISAYYFLTGQTRIAAALGLGSVLIPFVEGLGNWRGLLDGLGKYKTKSMWNSAIKLSYGITMIVVVVACYLLHISPLGTLLALVGTYYGVHGIGNIFALWRARPLINPETSTDPSATMYGMHLSFAGMIATIATYLDSVVIYNILGAEQLALYAFAIAPPEQLKSLLSNTALVSYTKLSLRTHTTAVTEIIRTLPRKALRACGISVALVIVYIVAAPFVYNVFFPKYTSSVLLSQIFALSLLVFPFGVFNTALDAIGNVRALYMNHSFAPIIQIILILVCIPLWGLWGAVVARVAGRYLNYAIAYLLLRHTSSLSPSYET